MKAFLTLASQRQTFSFFSSFSSSSSSSCSKLFSGQWASVTSFSTLSKPRLPDIKNEPLLDYTRGSKERKTLEDALQSLRQQQSPIEIPTVIGGCEVKTGDLRTQLIPSDHKKVIAKAHYATADHYRQAIDNAMSVKEKWASTPFEDRAAIFLKAADLISTKYRATLCAATMLGQGKTVWQAEIDAAAEVIDFFRFNSKFAEELYSIQPSQNSPYVWNRVEYRPLEGYVLAISPFNFTAIGANLVGAPAIMGNVVLWKPARTALLSNWIIYQVLKEAGLPDGVIQFLPSDGSVTGEAGLSSTHFGALHFTGSTSVFQNLWKTIGNNLPKYKTYPRIVGETGGKNFHFIHESASIDHVVNNMIRSAFEYQGQKCSALSRAYVPSNLWPKIKSKLVEEIEKIPIGQPDDFSTFVSAVIDKASWTSIRDYINYAKESQGKSANILVGGKCDDHVGYFIHPTVIETTDPYFKTMTEEIFGPVLTVYVYDPNKYLETLELCDKTSPYALTGSIFSKDRHSIMLAHEKLRNSAGNFYINDKCTGAVVGQQPFGGARASGTNDKAGSGQLLQRFISTRTIKETFVELPTWKYPHMV